MSNFHKAHAGVLTSVTVDRRNDVLFLRFHPAFRMFQFNDDRKNFLEYAHIYYKIYAKLENFSDSLNSRIARKRSCIILLQRLTCMDD
jgi:hypothetical protein